MHLDIRRNIQKKNIAKHSIFELQLACQRPMSPGTSHIPLETKSTRHESRIFIQPLTTHSRNSTRHNSPSQTHIAHKCSLLYNCRSIVHMPHATRDTQMYDSVSLWTQLCFFFCLLLNLGLAHNSWLRCAHMSASARAFANREAPRI